MQKTLIYFLPEFIDSSYVVTDPNGCIMLEPRELTVPEGVSAKTLKDMDRAIENFRMGTVSPAIDLSDF